jgi:hypothetical protein
MSNYDFYQKYTNDSSVTSPSFNSDIRAEVYKRQYGRELRKGVEGKVV